MGVLAGPAAGNINNALFEGGSFNAGLSSPFDLTADTVPNNWARFETFTGFIPPGATAPEWASISVVADNGPSAPGVSALQCTRAENPAGGSASGDWTAVQQNLAIDASLYSAMSLSIDTKVLAHNLAAGGWAVPAFEWPVTLEIEYTTQGGASQIWRYGWYIDPPGDVAGGSPVNDPGQGLIPVYNDMLVPQNVWVATTFSLFNELPQVKTIDRIRVGGSGWDYEGRADNLILTLEEAAEIPEPASALLVLTGAALVARRRRRA